MPAPLTSIFTAVNAQITANLASASIAPTYGDSGVDRAFVSKAPRIVWVPTDEDIGPPVGQGGDVTVDSAGNMNISGNPPILTRTVTVECDVWGIDRDTVDGTMIGAVYSAVDQAMYGSYGVLRARWLLPEESLKEGETYRIWFQFHVPVERVTPQTTTATIITIPMTQQVNPLVGP